VLSQHFHKSLFAFQARVQPKAKKQNFTGHEREANRK